jgi:hypothetical protein
MQVRAKIGTVKVIGGMAPPELAQDIRKWLGHGSLPDDRRELGKTWRCSTTAGRQATAAAKRWR